MSRNKSFIQLSKRQQRRRITRQLENDLDDLDAQLGYESDGSNKNVMEMAEYLNPSSNNSFEQSRMEMHTSSPCIKNIEQHIEIHENNSNPEVLDVHEEGIKDQEVLYLNEFNIFLENINMDDYDPENINFVLNDDSSDEDFYDDDSEELSEDNEFDLKTELRSWQQECFINRESMNKLLLILRQAGHLDLPKDARTLLGTPTKTTINSCPPGEYFHYGLKKSLCDILARTRLTENVTVDINIDGLPIAKSSNRTLWPIQGRVTENLSSATFVIGVYHGTQKPQSAETYLRLFINEYKALNKDGFEYANEHFTVNLRSVICDTPAANFVTCTKHYNGYFGCRKCMVEGDFMKRMVFLDENSSLRTNENFRSRENEEHHRDTSPFEALDIDMVKQFPLDYMHLVCLGVTKLLLGLWLKILPKLSAYQVQQLSTTFTDLTKYVPKEFNRKPQSLLDLSHWKATVYRFFLLYAGPIILDGFLSLDIIRHFNFLSCAIRILCSPIHYKVNNAFANDLLVKFVRGFKTLYGEQYITYNVHNLIHLAGDALNLGPLDCFSAFDFENNMQFIKKLLRKNEKPLQQIHRRLEEKLRPFNKRSNKLKEYPLLLRKINRVLPFNCTNCHKKLEFEHFELTDSVPDNCCFVDDQDVVMIESIGKRNNDIIIIGKKFLELKDIKNYPLNSGELGIYKVNRLSASKVFNARKITNKAFFFVHNNKHYVMPLLHN